MPNLIMVIWHNMWYISDRLYIRSSSCKA